jgi:hypothetical protein
LNETDPSSISIELMPLSRKAKTWIAVTEAGISSRVSDGQLKNAPISIVVSLDGRSNITDRRDSQDRKQRS